MKQKATPTRGRGRPPFVPSPESREDVIRWRENGHTSGQICRRLGICEDTLRKYLGREFEIGSRHLLARMAQVAVERAVGGDGEMLRFVLGRIGTPSWGGAYGRPEQPEQPGASPTGALLHR
jgi:hypothetical protein